MARALVPMLLAAFTIAACGGPSSELQQRDAYVGAVDQARATLKLELQRIDDRAAPTATPQSDARALAGYERAVARERLRLGRLTPPESAEAEHRALLAALRSYEVALSRARAAAARADVAVQRERLEAAAGAASTRVDAAVAGLRRALDAGAS